MKIRVAFKTVVTSMVFIKLSQIDEFDGRTNSLAPLLSRYSTFGFPPLGLRKDQVFHTKFTSFNELSEFFTDLFIQRHLRCWKIHNVKQNIVWTFYELNGAHGNTRMLMHTVVQNFLHYYFKVNQSLFAIALGFLFGENCNSVNNLWAAFSLRRCSNLCWFPSSHCTVWAIRLHLL
jgi:hypothetical protein